MILQPRNKTVLRLKLLAAAGILVLFSFVSSGASFFDMDSFSNSKDNSLSNTRADSWSYVGKNIVVKGNVYIPYGDITVYADRAIVNTESKDIEASGNIRLYKVQVKKQNIPIGDLIKLRAMPEVMVKIEGYSVDPLGNQTVDVEIHTRGDMIKCSRLSGNLSTGVLTSTILKPGIKLLSARPNPGLAIQAAK